MKKGFTLAEVLITLGIVAAVAILTIPATVKNYRYKVYSASLKKTYSQIQDAVNNIMADEMTSEFWKTSASDTTSGGAGGKYFLTNYFKYTRICDQNNRKNCIGDKYKASDGTLQNTYGHNCIITINGAGICYWNHPTGGSSAILIDVNGPAEPNMVGVDGFVAVIDRNTGEVKDWLSDPARCNVKGTGGNNHIGDYAAGCLAKAMQNDWVITED